MKKIIVILSIMLFTASMAFGAIIDCYPNSADYNTGSTDGTNFTQTSMIRTQSGEVEHGWARFDVSGISDAVTINSVELHIYVSEDNYAYFKVMQIENDPLLGTPASVFTDCADGHTYYEYLSNFPDPGWFVQDLGADAVTDLQAQLASDWFGVGLWEHEGYGDYYLEYDGWNETNPPYITVDYALAGAPGDPTNPNPADDATGVAASGNLTWDFGAATDTYDLWFGEAGSMVEVVTGADAVTPGSYAYSSLNGGTEYEWQVIAHNSADRLTTNGPVWSFMTAINSYPALEDFETFTVNTNATGYTNGWSTSPGNTTSLFRWNVDEGSTISGSTGPNVDHTTGSSTGNYLFTEASSGSAGDEAYVYSPIYDLSSLTTPLIKFWYHMYGAAMGELHLDIDAGSGWVNDITTALIGQQQANQSDPWLERTVDLSTYSGQTVKFRFRGIKGSSYTGDMAIDDVTVDEAPTDPIFQCSPSSKEFGAVNVGSSSTAQTFIISNIGVGTLTIDPAISITGTNSDQFGLADVNTYPVNLTAGQSMTVDVTFSPTSQGVKTANLHIVDNLARTEHDIPLSGNGWDDNYGGGGAAQGGYYFANSVAAGAPSQPSYSWIDYSGHTEITTWTSGSADDGYFTVPDIGFDFTYFGNTYRTDNVFIGSNGYLTFETGASGTNGGSSIPDTGAPDNMICGCAMDLDYDAGTPNGAIYYGGDVSQFVVTYYHYYDYNNNSEWITFQIILYPNGNIKIQYNDLESTTSTGIDNDALVGIENSDGTLGIEYRNNGSGGPMFGSDLAIMFGLDDGALPVELTSFTAIVVQNEFISINWTTQSECNMVGYKVYRSENDISSVDFVSEIIDAANTTEPHDYIFNDEEVEIGVTYNYWLESIDYDGATNLWGPISATMEGEIIPELPTVTMLYGNYPNPFNPSTFLKFDIKEGETAELTIFNVKGQVVESMRLDAGEHNIKWDAKSIASGVYFYKLKSESYTEIKKMLLLK